MTSGNYEKKIAQYGCKQREHKHLSFDWQLKTIDEKGVFAGYGSVFDVVDSQKDIVVRGAFKETIERRKGQIKLLWQHDISQPIGVIDEIFEDDNGLYVKGHLLLDVAKAREAYALLKQGVVSGMSIGYTPRKVRKDSKNGVRVIESVELWEVSLVTFPANDAARVTVVKSSSSTSDEMRRLNEEIKRAIAILTM